MNPNDTEESIWAMLCEARVLGFDEARGKMLTVGRDSRPVMRTAYDLFRGENEVPSLQQIIRDLISDRQNHEPPEMPTSIEVENVML